MISKANLKKTIRLAKEYNDKACQPTRFSLSDLESLMNQLHEFAPEMTALENHLRSLSYEEILDLEGLMDYGRNLDSQYLDIFVKKHFEEQREVFVQEHPSSDGKEEAIKYLMAKGPLAEYLKRAGEALELI